MIVINERHLMRVLKSYFEYYHSSRTHLGLEKDCPEPRAVEGPEVGKVIAMPKAGGLHHPRREVAASKRIAGDRRSVEDRRRALQGCAMYPDNNHGFADIDVCIVAVCFADVRGRLGDRARGWG